MDFKTILVALSMGLVVTACNKEGEGGTSIISGTLIGQNHSSSKSEVTEVIITNGLEVEHGDYWLLNSPFTNNYFYIWYDNPTWISNGDPTLNGRTGIPVTFNYSDSNTEIALNTANAILDATGSFEIEILNDILRVKNTTKGDTPDANEVTSPFEINIEVQGEDEVVGKEKVLVDEKVYLTYGQNTVFSDEVETGPSGVFQFINLTKGEYTVHIYSKDTLSGEMIFTDYNTSLIKNKSEVNIGVINVLF
jgi:hypothetical protein